MTPTDRPLVTLLQTGVMDPKAAWEYEPYLSISPQFSAEPVAWGAKLQTPEGPRCIGVMAPNVEWLKFQIESRDAEMRRACNDTTGNR